MGQPVTKSWSPARAILVGTLVVGTLDALDALVVFGLLGGATPPRIFRSIARGVLGADAATGGTPAALLGVVLHYTIACGIVTTYVAATRVLPGLNRRPFVFGPLYGVVAFIVMNLVVLPLSAIGAVPQFTAFGLTNGLLIHMLGVGLPAALVASRVRRPRAGRQAASSASASRSTPV